MKKAQKTNRKGQTLVLRTHLSGYLPADYQKREKKIVEGFEGLRYTLDWEEAKQYGGDLILLTNTTTTMAMLRTLPVSQLKLLVHGNSGYDNFDASWVHGLLAPVVLGNQIRARAVAEYILKALLERHGPLPHAPKWDRTRAWKRMALSEMTVQILGLGHIGQILQTALNPLAGRVCVYDPHLNERELNLGSAHAIIFACGLNHGSRHFLAQDSLARLRPDVHIINAARGGLIDEGALAEFLAGHPKAFATLDVFENEPHIHPGLLKLPNASLTSHIAGVFDQLPERQLEFVSQVLGHYQHEGPEDFAQTYQRQLLQTRCRVDAPGGLIELI